MREVVAEAAGGPILLLGVGGKMGPSLAALLIRAGAKHVVGVSRFSDPAERAYLDGLGVETIAADLLAEGALASLPDAPAVFFLAGFKFGASTEENSGMTWAMNALLPAEVVRRYSTSRIVYVSSGNVYPFTPVTGAGAAESDGVGPVGEYAQSRLGGERLAMHVAAQHSTPLCVVRLFYATECRYGIIQDLAQKVLEGEPIPLAMGHVNQIWQGDANAMIARCLPLCAHPARVRNPHNITTSLGWLVAQMISLRSPAECLCGQVLNVTGKDVLSVRSLSESLGELLGRQPVFEGTEAPTALLGDASEMLHTLGEPSVSVEQIVAWVGAWVQEGGRSLGKPTKFESREGKF